MKNIEACSLIDSSTEITNKDLHNIAVDLEYEAFTSSKVVAIYRKKIAKTVSYILIYYTYVLLSGTVDLGLLPPFSS